MPPDSPRKRRPFFTQAEHGKSPLSAISAQFRGLFCDAVPSVTHWGGWMAPHWGGYCAARQKRRTPSGFSFQARYFFPVQTMFAQNVFLLRKEPAISTARSLYARFPEILASTPLFLNKPLAPSVPFTGSMLYATYLAHDRRGPRLVQKKGARLSSSPWIPLEPANRLELLIY